MIVAGLPAFVKYDVDDNKVKAVEQLEESSRIIKPPNIEEYPYEPYEFANIKEVEKYVDRAKGETVDSLYLKVKSISQKYNDQDEHKIVLLAQIVSGPTSRTNSVPPIMLQLLEIVAAGKIPMVIRLEPLGTVLLI